jgi:hypothetical protein
MEELTGGCFCGAIRYRSAAPTRPATLCHCVSCRRAAGTHALGHYTVQRAQFMLTKERPTEYRSSPGVFRGFCGQCGTTLTYWNSGQPQDISVTIGSLDDPRRVPPIDHTWMLDAVEWDKPSDGMPHFAAGRPDR